ncbi:MAG: hypothetical protein AAFZ67_01080 [Planctomycetota bacterium]
MPSRQIVLFRPEDVEDAAAGMVELGSPRGVIRELEPFNTSPDGSKGSSLGTLTLHGPGLVVDLPTAADELKQVMVTVVEEDTAWPVLARLCRSLGWKMMDPESGRTFM